MVPFVAMNTTASRGQLRERPGRCEVGDWITARSRPEWDGLASTARYASDLAGPGEMTFRLEPYVNGKRVSVWVRVE